MLDYPILLTDDGKPQAILQNAFDVYVSDQVIDSSSGSETLEFKIPYNDSKRFYITNEDVVSCYGRRFVVRTLDDDKDTDFYTTVFCEALWYDIGIGEPIMSCNLVTVDARTTLDYILQGTGWTSGIIEPTILRSFEVTEAISRLTAVRQMPTLYECEMYFDSENKTVNLVTEVGQDTKFLVSYAYNSDSVKRNIDSREIYTRAYLYGKDGLTIKDINLGFEYVENYDYYDELGKARVIKSTVISDDRFTNINSLKAYGESYLAVNSKPKYSYTVKVYVIDQMVNLGDRIIVYDKDLGIKGYMRIVSRKINVLEIENSELQLDNTLKNITDQMASSVSSSSDTASTTDDALSEVSMFNLLLNSRADYGYNYWVNSGFEVDATKGVSGNASFKCTGALGQEKTLSQEAIVSNRDYYTISAQIEMNDLVTTTDSQLGFEITLEFDDGSTKTQFISMI